LVELCVLGAVEVGVARGRVAFTRAKERALLATLGLSHGRAVSTDRLVDAVWGDGAPQRPEKVLQTYVQRVRAVLGAGVIETVSDGYALAAGVAVDAELFEAEAAAGPSVQCLRDALARWRGEPYVDLGEWPPAEIERERLGELRDRALERCVGLEIDTGLGGDCIAELEAMVAEKPLRERRWFLLMTALSRDGRVADALRAYQRAAKVFVAELGIDPGPELRALEEQILLADVRAPSSGRLPRHLTSFVGRAREIVQVTDLVREAPLVTLTGVGGVGKTRLALEVAGEASPEFRDGVSLCELAPVADPDVVWVTLATSLGVRPIPGRRVREVVLEYLGAKRLLIVVDNCEHLVAAVGDVVEAIVQFCPRTAVLATSRERLALAGERIVAVAPLPVPPADANLELLVQSDAVRLFRDRARDVDAGFRLTDDNAGAVAQLCRCLDGIPLALELAAAKTRSFSPDDLLASVRQRFGLLTDGSRSTPRRHQTLRNMIDWSYDMLSEPEQRVLNRMSVVAGGCDLASAEAIIAGDDIAPLDVVELLSHLINKSLVEVDVAQRPGRYRLLEPIRQYAQERLDASGETRLVRGRHLVRYVGLAEQAGPHLRGRDQLHWAARIARDFDNFRAALDWAVEAERADDALRLVVPLMVMGLSPAWTVTVSWAETAIAIPDALQSPLYPVAAAIAASGAIMRGDVDRAAKLVATAQEVQSRLGTDHLGVDGAAAVVAFVQGDVGRARLLAQTCVERARATEDPYEITTALIAQASTLYPEPAKVGTVAEEAVHIARDAGILSNLLYALILLLPNVAPEQTARRLALIDEAADVAYRLGDRQAIAMVDTQRAAVAILQKDWPAALHRLVDAAEAHVHAGQSQAFGGTLGMASIALAHLQRFEPAAVLAGAADGRMSITFIDEYWQTMVTASNQQILDALGATRVEQLRAHGANLTFADAVAYLRNASDGTHR
jgi:predicted ATPase/DNA-binding SARP family transcriptional activator